MKTYDIDRFYTELVEHRLILPTGVKGAYGRGPVFEDIVRAFNDLVTRIAAPDGAEELMFPPILARALIEKVGYLDNFPQLAGSVHSFMGNDMQAVRVMGSVRIAVRQQSVHQFVVVQSLRIVPELGRRLAHVPVLEAQGHAKVGLHIRMLGRYIEHIPARNGSEAADPLDLRVERLLDVCGIAD